MTEEELVKITPVSPQPPEHHGLLHKSVAVIRHEAWREGWAEGWRDAIRQPPLTPLTHDYRKILERARNATSTLRDATRDGREIGYRERDPLVVAIHAALDLVENIQGQFAAHCIQCPQCQNAAISAVSPHPCPTCKKPMNVREAAQGGCNDCIGG